MKTIRFSLTALLGLAALAGVRAADTPAAPRAEVIFSHPENFTDAADGPRGSDFGRTQILDSLRDYIVRRAAVYIPAGQKLTVTITDVDLAGEIEPWRSAQMQDVRIVRSIYPPKIDLSFKLTDASGAVLKEGKRQLRDMNFDMKIYPFPDDPRKYEKGLLDDWLSSEFPRARK